METNVGMQEKEKEENWGEGQDIAETGSPYIFALFLAHFWWQSLSGTLKEVDASYCPGTK